LLKILLLVLAVTAVVYTVVLVRTAYRCDALGLRCEGALLGAVTNFFDTLGIGSFAPSTAWIKLRKLVPDSHIPGVLISGHALPTIAQALIYITLVEVDPVLLVVSIAASVAGALAGVPIALRLPVRSIQIIVGIALPLAGGLFAAANLGLMPAGGDARGLPPWLFGLALVGAFITGALMTVGIGFYSPLLAMFSLMGLNPVAVFPIMGRRRGADDARQRAALHQVRPHRFETRLVTGARRHPGGVGGGLYCQFVAARDAAPGRRRGGHLHRHGDAAHRLETCPNRLDTARRVSPIAVMVRVKLR
jgi:hypothetical protein